MNFVYFFPFFFIGMWIAVSYMISKMGWVRLVEKFKADKEFDGKRIGVISATINSGNYRNAIVLKYNYKGIYLRPIIFFRLFHPPVFIPWNEIRDVRDRKILFTNVKEIVVGDPFVAMITLKGSVYDKIKRPLESNTGR